MWKNLCFESQFYTPQPYPYINKNCKEKTQSYKSDRSFSVDKNSKEENEEKKSCTILFVKLKVNFIFYVLNLIF